MRIANRDARAYVEVREEFEGSNITAWDTASTTGTDLYVVCSYGEHFPMYIAEEHDGVVNWYGNEDKWGITTSKHKTQARPFTDEAKSMQWFDTQQMILIMKHGITGMMARGQRE